MHLVPPVLHENSPTLDIITPWPASNTLTYIWDRTDELWAVKQLIIDESMLSKDMFSARFPRVTAPSLASSVTSLPVDIIRILPSSGPAPLLTLLVFTYLALLPVVGKLLPHALQLVLMC